MPDAPAPAVAPPPGNPRFPLLDALRAVAALSVLFTHVAGATHLTQLYAWGPLVANGDQGVTVFFVLSGFLLYRPMVSARLGDAPRSRWPDYARRRLLRIVPAYWLALTVLAIYPGLPGVFTVHYWWYYYLFLQVYNHDVSIGGIVIAWSLCVEVSFYLALPVYAGLVGRLLRGRAAATAVRVELGLLAALGAGSLVLRYLDSGFPITLPVYMQWFAIGMGLAVLSATQPAAGGRSRALALITRRPGLCWAGAGVLYVILSFALGRPPALGYSNLKEVLLHRLLGGVIALLLVLPAVFGDDRGGRPRRVLAWPALGWLGLISYGIYLWHLNLLELAVAHLSIRGNSGLLAFVVLLTITVLAAVAVAAVSYYVVERPLLRFKPARAGGAPRDPRR